MFKKPFVVLDLETTGMEPKTDDIIEVALIRYENGKEVDRYEDLIKVDYELPEIIVAITGITDAALKKDGKKREGVMTKVEELLKGAYLVGHNIQFDEGFLKASGIDLDILGTIDTIPLAQILFPEQLSYSLESLADDFELAHTEKHRAMGDTEATLALFKLIYKNIQALPRDSISEIQKHIPKASWYGGELFMEVRGSSPQTQMKEAREALREEKKEEGIQKALEIDEIFKDGGILQSFWDEYEAREQQVEMSQNVMTAFQEKFHLICEAPTGVGKSLAYLTAAANIAIKNKSKVIISTNTINLQQQLYEKDIPLLQKIYKEGTGHQGFRAAILKGRSHYLCLRRFAEFKRRPRFNQEEVILLTKILVWEAKTQTGDSAEIHLARHEHLIWDFELCSDKKYCSPVKCKPYGQCYLHRAREIAEEADIIIVNHALLCADLQSDGALLPDFSYLVVDEAHHLEEVATKAYGLDISQENVTLPIKVITNHLEDLRRRYEGSLFESQTAVQLLNPILDHVDELKQTIDNTFSVIALFVNRNVEDSGYIENLLVDKVIRGSDEWLNLSTSVDDLGQKVNEWLKMLRELGDAVALTEGQEFPEQEEFIDELMQEIGLLAEQMTHIKTFFDDEESKTIRWLSSSYTGEVRAHLAPMMIGPILKDELYDKKKSIILTSATMAIQINGGDMSGPEPHPFTYIRTMLGLDESWEEMVLSSPFNFETQAYVLLPEDALPIMAQKSMDQVSDFFENLIKGVKGNTLGLFTSYRAIEQLYLKLMRTLKNDGTTLLAQRISGGRNKILKAYLNNPANSVLFGTASFWEGVDIKGDALSTLVIHKLPFDMPYDPIFKVRSDMFNNGFFEYAVPRAILRFRQGFGRLIRSKKDFGAMIVLDERVMSKKYGQMFLDALPNVTIEQFPIAEIPAKVEEWLALSK